MNQTTVTAFKAACHCVLQTFAFKLNSLCTFVRWMNK